MFFTAIYRGLHVDYVLVDSWFTCDTLIQAIRGVKNKEVHLIGMYKFAKTRFEYQGKSLTHVQVAETTISIIAYPTAEAMIMALSRSVIGKGD